MSVRITIDNVETNGANWAQVQIVLCAALSEYSSHRCNGDAVRYVSERYPYLSQAEAEAKAREVRENLATARAVLDSVRAGEFRADRNAMPLCAFCSNTSVGAWGAYCDRAYMCVDHYQAMRLRADQIEMNTPANPESAEIAAVAMLRESLGRP